MSSQYTLVVLETTHIQPYVFGSNRLKENVGASYLVKVATQDWVYDSIRDIGLIPQPNLDEHQETNNIKKDDIVVEVLYAGGGNTALLFGDKQKAIDFTRALSRKVLRHARGLQLVFHHVDFNWDTEPLACAVSNAIKSLKSKRNEQPPRMGIGGLGVTAMCASTSLPATHLDKIDDDWQPVSAEVFAKRQYADNANDELRELFNLPTVYTFPLDFDDMGAPKGEKNTIAVVHADGNGLGEIIQGLKDNFPSSGDNRDYIKFMRQFSEGVKELAKNAQKETIAFLLNSPFIKDKESKTLPFRPLVSGGDDVTFVCEGRIGIALAVKFLEMFEELSKDFIQKLEELKKGVFEGKKSLTACAGIAIVNTKYPFARAYDLAEELCSSAKKARKSNDIQGSAFDWHYTTGGLYDNLAGMREREYTRSDGTLLHSRPIMLVDNPHFQTWEQLQANIQIFSGWGESRNKAKGLIGAIRISDKAVEQFTEKYLFKKDYQKLETPSGKSTTWYDALELMDLYIDLKKMGANS